MTETDSHMSLRPAQPGEVAALSRLAVHSKGVWGYSSVFLEECRAELTLAVADLIRLHVVVAESPSGLAGFYSLAVQEQEAEVSHFFVEPRVIGTGVGRALWRHLITTAEEMGLLAVHIEADPNAEGFYLAMGATRAGVSPSGSIPGRTLPRLRYITTATPGRP